MKRSQKLNLRYPNCSVLTNTFKENTKELNTQLDCIDICVSIARLKKYVEYLMKQDPNFNRFKAQNEIDSPPMLYERRNKQIIKLSRIEPRSKAPSINSNLNDSRSALYEMADLSPDKWKNTKHSKIEPVAEEAKEGVFDSYSKDMPKPYNEDSWINSSVFSHHLHPGIHENKT